MRNQGYFPFYLLLTGVCIVLLLPVWLQHGMFMDGVQYACVSKNLAAGKGSFWFPFLCESWWYGTNRFMEHPPLFYAIESVFFKLFGNGMYTERIFCATAAIVNALLIHLTWKLIAEKYALEKKMSWFPLLAWISIPVCFWSFQNNIIEILVSVFTLMSVYFTLHLLFKQHFSVLLLILSGLCIFFATLTKGIPGFFPIVTIPLFYLFTREISFKKAAAYSLVVAAVPLLIYALLLGFHDKARESLVFYFTERLLHRIQNVPSTDTRFFIIGGLLSEFVPVVVAGLLLLFVRTKKGVMKERMPFFYFLLALGLSGVLPLMITMVQNKFYFVPALPFFALAFGILLYPRIQKLSEAIRSVRSGRICLLVFSFLLCASGIVYSIREAGKDFRDEETLSEVRLIGPVVQNTTLISVEKEIYEDWNFQFYLLRYYDVSITPLKDPLPYLITQRLKPDSIYQRVPLPTKKHTLYKRVP
ncbi:MAG: hypothetical protein K0S33_2092 [Bacteroidetes bacterium]|jgi:hypothetical protein|nr:hypothetical protein [Bacteroidota bacterium]